MNKEKESDVFKSKIGGQALIEGIMMRGTDTAAMACRLSDGKIDIEQWPVKNGKDAPFYTRAPFLRGCFNFFINLKEGIRCIMKSAEKQAEDGEEEELSKFEIWLQEKFGDKLMPVLMTISMIIALAVSVALFKFLPMLITSPLRNAGAPQSSAEIVAGETADESVEMSAGRKRLLAVIEGTIRIALLVGYMSLVSLTKSMKTTFRYHGAEHKTITCYEKSVSGRGDLSGWNAEEELTVEKIRPCSRFHPRCGTSFLLIVALISVIVGMFLPWENIAVRFLMQLIMLIPEASIAYELIKLAGRYNNAFTRIISAPGLWLQRITTKEPEDGQIEVAIAAILPCLPKDLSEDKW